MAQRVISGIMAPGNPAVPEIAAQFPAYNETGFYSSLKTALNRRPEMPQRVISGIMAPGYPAVPEIAAQFPAYNETGFYSSLKTALNRRPEMAQRVISGIMAPGNPRCRRLLRNFRPTMNKVFALPRKPIPGSQLDCIAR